MASSHSSQSRMHQERGYDYRFVDGLPSHDYICFLCNLVARDAQQTTCCGNVFCKRCLETSPKAKIGCPSCDSELNSLYMYFQDTNRITKINKLKVYCRNQEEGCVWEGELCDAQTHHDSCPYRQVGCPNQCTEAVRSMDLQQHLETQCPKREVECRRCKQIGEYAYISTDHSEDCPDLRIDCLNEGCQVKPKRRDMEVHRQQCPKETISCEYAKLGCEHVCPREDIADHNEKQVQGHLQLAINKLTILSTSFESRTGASKVHLLKMTSFSRLKEKEQVWHSPPFYAFPGGYKMCLRVDAGGHANGKGTHISAFLFLMAGENDGNLEWPMRGIFTIELLNQEKDQNHKKGLIRFVETRANEWNNKVRKDRAPSAWGIEKFVEHQDLKNELLPPQTQYLKDDSLYFRVTMTEQISKSKPWLAGAIHS